MRGAEICELADPEVANDEALGRDLARVLGVDLAALELLKTVTLGDAFRLAGARLAPRYGGGSLDLTQVELDALVLANLPAFHRERARLREYAKMVLAL